jgi:N-acetylmuramic acid 6-phosphate etherase
VGAEAKLILGIDGGATKTTWSLCESREGSLQVVQEGRAGPGSMKLLDPAALKDLLVSLPSNAGQVGVFLAGCATEHDRVELQKLAAAVWPGAKIRAGSDRESGFAAAFGQDDGITVIAGTGSAITARRDGVEDQAGGWGHLLGDSGGGYDLAIHALRQILFDYDTRHHITNLASDVLRTLGLNTLRDLTSWAQTAHKHDLARLTPVVFAHAEDENVSKILHDGAEALAVLAAAVAVRLEFPDPSIRLLGGVFQNCALYTQLFTTAIREKLPAANVGVCQRSPSLGAAMRAAETTALSPVSAPAFKEATLAAAETEQPNPRSSDLHLLSTGKLVELFLNEERHVENALAQVAGSLTRAVELISAALRDDGRLFYVGSGTSGRLGVLDASEMPPTFGVPPDLVQAIIAGGATAIQQSIEGAEDDATAAELAVRDRGVAAGDVVCGITASGRTPFVRAALSAAKAIGAHTILLTCNPARPRGDLSADIAIDLPTGPELITGSTRLKAGTATKVALNILSSCAMIQLGRVDGNLMSCLQPANDKLRDRATRIVAERLNLDEAAARTRLQCANWNIRSVLNSGRDQPRENGTDTSA